jgi:hypothetical protein
VVLSFCNVDPAAPPLFYGKYGGLLASSVYPRIYAATSVSLPILPYFPKTNMDTLWKRAEGSPVAEFIDASLLLHDGLQPKVDRLVCGTLV